MTKTKTYSKKLSNENFTKLAVQVYNKIVSKKKFGSNTTMFFFQLNARITVGSAGFKSMEKISTNDVGHLMQIDNIYIGGNFLVLHLKRTSYKTPSQIVQDPSQYFFGED